MKRAVIAVVIAVVIAAPASAATPGGKFGRAWMAWFNAHAKAAHDPLLTAIRCGNLTPDGVYRCVVTVDFTSGPLKDEPVCVVTYLGRGNRYLPGFRVGCPKPARGVAMVWAVADGAKGTPRR